MDTFCLKYEDDLGNALSSLLSSLLSKSLFNMNSAEINNSLEEVKRREGLFLENTFFKVQCSKMFREWKRGLHK